MAGHRSLKPGAKAQWWFESTLHSRGTLSRPIYDRLTGLERLNLTRARNAWGQGGAVRDRPATPLRGCSGRLLGGPSSLNCYVQRSATPADGGETRRCREGLLRKGP